jgi:hypothetical protein
VQSGPKAVPLPHVKDRGIWVAGSGQKRFSQAPGSDGIGPFAPPPRPPAAAQTVPQCFEVIQMKRGAERVQAPAQSPEGKTRGGWDSSPPSTPPLYPASVSLNCDPQGSSENDSRGDHDL